MSYRYIILDSRDAPVARGLLENSPDSLVWHVRVLDDGVNNVLDHELLQLVSMDDNAPAKLGRLLRQKDDIIALEPIEALDGEIRQNLRVMTHFNTYIYPVTGKWKGRIPVISHDLSCGGIAFFCVYPLEKGEQVDIVVPITGNPVILRAQVVRPRPSTSKIQLYASKFLDLLDGEEAMVREAVFGQQIQNKQNQSG